METSLDLVDSLKMAAGSDISADATTLLLVALFVGLMFYLNRMLFQPYLRVKELRNLRIGGVIAAAKATQERADELFTRYQDRIGQARKEALEQKVDIRLSAKQMQQEILGEARAENEEILRRTRSEIEQAVEEAQSDIETQAARLATVIVAKIVPG